MNSIRKLLASAGVVFAFFCIISANSYAQRSSTNTIATGTSAVGVNWNLFNITSDSVAVTGANFLNGFTFQQSVNSSSVQGGRQTLYSLLQFQSPTSSSNINRNYVAGAYAVDVQSRDGGTNTSSGAQGAFFGMNSSAIAEPGATNLLELTGGEINWAAKTGSSLRYKAGFSIVALGTDAVSGSQGDSMLLFGAQSGAVGSNTGIQFASINGQYPVKTTGTLIDAGSGTIANGLNFANATVTGSVLNMATGQTLNLGGGATVSNNGVKVAGGIQGTFVRTYATTYAGLTAADPSPVKGDRAYITDAMSCSFNKSVSGGGNANCPIIYDGMRWVAG
jgi:hypothetical protein